MGRICPPLVEIGLTDLPKSGGARAPPAPPACDRPEQLNALLSQLKLDCALLASKVMDAKVQYALLFSTGTRTEVCVQ